MRIFLVDRFESVVCHYAFDDDRYSLYERIATDSTEQSLPPDSFEIALLEEFLGVHASEPYKRLRISIAKFCMDKHISVEKLIRYIKHAKSTYARLFRITILRNLEKDQGLSSLQKLMFRFAIAANIH